MFCPNCKSELNDGAVFCGNCGAKLSTYESENSGASQKSEYSSGTTNNSTQFSSVPYAAPSFFNENQPLKISQYFWMMVLQRIPVVRLIVFIIWSCSETNKSRKNFSIAYLIFYLVSICISIVLAVSFFSLFFGLFSAFQPEMQSYFSSLA